jgi:predicted DNA-binding protein
VAPKGNEFDRQMQQLEAEIKKLEAEYNMFFAGRLPRLPWETRKRIEELVKRHDRTPMKNTAERFRFASLQARFQSFLDLWEKHLKAKEEGRPIAGRSRTGGGGPPARTAPPTPEAKASASEANNEREKAVHETSFRDPSQEAERLKELYHQLADARAKTGEAPIPYDRFAEAVRAQVSKFGGGAADVKFRVETKEGKVTMKVETDTGEEGGE